MDHIIERIRRRFKKTETHDEQGREIKPGLSQPVEVPIGFRTPQLTIEEQIARALRSREIMERQAARGEETLEDSMDFGEDDGEQDEFGVSVHEVRDMREDVVRQGAVEHQRQELRAKHKQQQQPKAEPVDDKKEGPKGRDQVSGSVQLAGERGEVPGGGDKGKPAS